MTAYINGLACISPFNTINENYFFEDVVLSVSTNKMLAMEPAYKDYIPAALIRRMSHIVKMGVSTGTISLKNAGLDKVDAIIVGTGIGCYDDSDKFLRAMIDNGEQLLTPTSFIQSTHNTVAGQLALLLKCHGYNFTYVHQNLSFEYALKDAMMLINNRDAETVLVGGIDEINSSIFELFDKAGYIRNSGNNKGYNLGEGAAFFCLSAEKTSASIAKVMGVQCFQTIEGAEQLLVETDNFLSSLGLNKKQISLVLSGNCGDEVFDARINEYNLKLNLPVSKFKSLCGEYFTSSAFAVWLAATILKKQTVPSAIQPMQNLPNQLSHVLIVNHYQDKQYSLMCMSLC